MAKTSIGQFLREVGTERRRIVWPTRRETMATAITVVLMTTALAIFFFGVDAAFSGIVRFLLGLLG